MLTIRADQMTALSDDVMQKFQGRLVAHLNDVFPKKCEAFGDERVRTLAREGTADAQKYGIVAEQNVVKYVDLTFIVRPDLDVARETPWAKAILNDATLNGPEKIGRLYSAARRNRYKINDEVAPPTPEPVARVGATPGVARPVSSQPQIIARPIVPRRPPTSIGSVPPL